MSDTQQEQESNPIILVVDDSKLMRRAISKLLGKNYDIVEAEDGEAGWKQLNKVREIQMVFCDLAMPKLDGFGLLKRIRDAEDRHIESMPVVIITGAEDDEASKAKALEMGASDFISKPFDSVQLQTRAKTHVDARKASQTREVLEETSTIDPVTRLSNARAFDERALKDLAFSQRHDADLALLRLDLDNFHSIFMKHGKEVGNALLREIAAVLQEQLRKEDTVARIGVFKFAALLPSADPTGARQMADRVVEIINQRSFADIGVEGPVSVSIGAATPVITSELVWTEMLNMAESALAEAVKQGGNSVVTVPEGLAESDQELQAGVPPLLPDLDSLADMAARGQTGQLRTQAEVILARILPLLEFVNGHLNLGIDDALDKLRNRKPGE